MASTSGTGHPRRFSFRNVFEVRLAVVLAGYGLRADALQFVLSHLRSRLRTQPPTHNDLLVVSGELATPRQFWIGTHREFLRECRDPRFLGHAGLFVNVGGLLADMETHTNDRW